MAHLCEKDVVYAGWLERKGTSMITPWTRRWVVLKKDNAKHYMDEKMTQFKGELKLDETTRVILVDQVHYSTYKFCLSTASDMLEFSVQDMDERNMWIQKLLHVAEAKSELGCFVMRVSTDADYRNARLWEASVVAHSIDRSSGLVPKKSSAASIASEKTTQGSRANSPTPKHAMPGVKSASSTPDVTASPSPAPMSNGDTAAPHLNALKDTPRFASFMPFDAWQDSFEPEVRQAREQQEREEELRSQGLKNGSADSGASSIDRMRDYLVESIVTNMTTVSTTKSCRLLLEGMAQLIAASERQLARKYHLATIAAEAAASAAMQNANATCDHAESSTTASVAEMSLNAEDSEKDKKNKNVDEGEEEEEIPLPVQEDLLCTLGSLRALILTYRFESAVPAVEAQIAFTRRLAIHQLERSLSRVLKGLEDLQHLEQQDRDQEKDNGKVIVDSSSAVITSAVTASAAGEGGGRVESKEARARRASLKQLRNIMRPLLSREFLQLEAAPLLQDFAFNNSSAMKSLEGLAAEVTTVFGGVMQTFVEKKINDMEEMVINQLEVFVHVIADNGDKIPNYYAESSTKTSEASQK